MYKNTSSMNTGLLEKAALCNKWRSTNRIKVNAMLTRETNVSFLYKAAYLFYLHADDMRVCLITPLPVCAVYSFT